MATSVEDDLILVGKIKIELNGFKENSSLGSWYTKRINPIVQRLSNELLALKKKIAQSAFSSPYEDISRRPYPNTALSYVAKNQDKLPSSPEKLVLEAPPTNIAVENSESEQSDLANLFHEEEAYIVGISHI